ncbi:MAG: histidine phosphatase family protein [Burkholderiaceae bacterium]|jgi:phosphohistidine phosphatase SixA
MRLANSIWVLLVCALGWSLPAVGSVDERLLAALREPGVVILMRHAQTEPGFGDPPSFRVDDCSTQRNLSPEGLAQSERFGRWMQSHGLRPTRVRSSQWCRCLDTARAAFGPQMRVEPWTALNSFFQGHGNRDAQLAEARAVAAQIRTGLEVWVTHQVTISALTGSSVSMGEFVVARPGANGQLVVLGRGLVD